MKKNMNLILKALSITLLPLLVTACSQEKEDDNKIVFGFGPSAYATQFEESIKPILEKQGYEVSAVVFSRVC